MLANVALIHSLGSDVTRVHSHISLNKVPKFSQNCFIFFSKLIHSPGPDVTRVHSHWYKLSNNLRTNANKTLDSFVTSFI